MKKKILALLLCLSLVFSSGFVMAATLTPTVKEDKTAKIFVDGVALKTINVPILNNTTPMLSTELFTALGINAKNQVWDKSKTKLTLTKGKAKVVLQINSANVILNGKKITLSVKPIKYKNKAYFPTDFIAECFDKQLSVDIETNTYFMKDKAEFAKSKKLFENIQKAMYGISKLKISENVTYSLSAAGEKIGVVNTSTTLIDRESKLDIQDVKFKFTKDQETAETNVQIVYANDKQYIQTDGGEWEHQDFTTEEYAVAFDSVLFDSEPFNFDDIYSYNDVICSALNSTTGVKKDEIVLKGNMLLGNSLSLFFEKIDIIPSKISTKSVEVTLNTKTNIVSKIVLKETGTTIVEGVTCNFSVNHVTTYSDINGSFEVVVPSDLN